MNTRSHAVVLACALALLAGCVDEPVCFSPRGGGAVATRLSALALFRDVRTLAPADGVVAYQVAVPLYSDGASKHRFIALPKGAALGARDDRWDIPIGTQLVKTFYVPKDARDPGAGETRIETRILERDASGFRGGTYVWNDAQDDAVCSGGNVDVGIDFVDETGARQSETFHVPGTSRCLTCHGDGADSHALGLRTRQMDVPQSVDDDATSQIEHLVALGVLDTAPRVRQPLPDPFGDAPLDARAQSYLDVNCGTCHFDHGYAKGTNVFFDLGHSHDVECKKTAAIDGRDHIVVPGAPQQSELLARMTSEDLIVRMPLGVILRPDTRGIDLLTRWIGSLPPRKGACP